MGTDAGEAQLSSTQRCAEGLPGESDGPYPRASKALLRRVDSILEVAGNRLQYLSRKVAYSILHFWKAMLMVVWGQSGADKELTYRALL